jgi:H/ACA ribonucleoprotein complex subunit 4
VTGVLPVTLEDGTKVVQTLLHGGKEYICVMRLHGSVGGERVRAAMAEFTGEIYQRPPLRSSVRRSLRRRRIYYLDPLEIQDRLILFKIGCEAGTYIRKLVFDLGEVLGCGAHMEELRRTRAGPFVEDEGLVTMYDVYAAHEELAEGREMGLLRRVVQPVEKCVDLVPKVYVRDSAVDALCHGADLTVPGVLRLETGIKPRGLTCLMTQKGELIALGRAEMPSESILQESHGVAVKSMRVIMPAGTYPKMWRTHRRKAT